MKKQTKEREMKKISKGKYAPARDLLLLYHWSHLSHEHLHARAFARGALFHGTLVRRADAITLVADNLLRELEQFLRASISLLQCNLHNMIDIWRDGRFALSFESTKTAKSTT
jgi:hypothetical protein